MTLITIKAPYSESIVITLRADSKLMGGPDIDRTCFNYETGGEKLNYLNRVNRYFGIG